MLANTQYMSRKSIRMQVYTNTILVYPFESTILYLLGCLARDHTEYAQNYIECLADALSAGDSKTKYCHFIMKTTTHID